jgi:hypothetical protein
MPTELREAFIRYAERVSSLSQRVAILPNKKRHLANLVEEIEEGSEFHTLVQATRDEFGNTEIAPDGDMTPISIIWATHYESDWRHAVGNVLRRSGFYMNIFEKKLNDPSEEFEKYVQVFKSSERKISYLAPLEYVSFEQNEIDCGHFQIKRFSRDGLDAVLGNSVNKNFYPWAAVELEEIKDYWFIYFEQTGPAPEIGCSPLWDLDLFDDDRYRVKMRYSPLSEPIESAIKPLVLFDWQTDYWRREPADEKEEKATGWMGFNIPLVLKVTDKLYERPLPAPSLEKLEKPILRFVTENGKEIWGPEVYISLDKQETESLITFVKRTHENLGKLDFDKSGWYFCEIALNMLVKAFFADGLEQLLWHITTIEALLGEDPAGLTEKLARRVASILGETADKQEKLRSCFKKLYNFRSILVHGKGFNDKDKKKNQKKKKVYLCHLREARDFARQTLIWFLDTLATIQHEIIEGKKALEYPERELILKVVDIKYLETSLTKEKAESWWQKLIEAFQK